MSQSLTSRLFRKVRVALDQVFTPRPLETLAWTNNWLGGPTVEAFVPRVELVLSIRDDVDSTTGYIEDIVVMDRWVRETLIEWPDATAVRHDPVTWLVEFHRRLQTRDERLRRLDALELQLTPQWILQILWEPSLMILVTRQYEFSAAHRLHSHALSDEENQQLYGKCNNFHGHGHNYVLDVSLSGDVPPHSGMMLPSAEFDRIVRERVIARLDHRFLNREVPPFQELNPTVEHIARTIWEWLDGAFAPARLFKIRLYETAKTWVDVQRDTTA